MACCEGPFNSPVFGKQQMKISLSLTSRFSISSLNCLRNLWLTNWPFHRSKGESNCTPYLSKLGKSSILGDRYQRSNFPRCVRTWPMILTDWLLFISIVHLSFYQWNIGVVFICPFSQKNKFDQYIPRHLHNVLLNHFQFRKVPA